MTRPIRQRGFAYIAAIVFLVVLAGFALALLRLQNAQQATIDGGIQGMRAGQAARGGLEWAFYRLRDGKAAGCTQMQGDFTLNAFAADTGFRVTLACRALPFSEGETVDIATGVPKPVTKAVYEIDAIACNGAAAACPDAGSVAGRDYVERKRSATICVTTDGGDC
jgi:MSHA biogenesis protein MshP